MLCERKHRQAVSSQSYHHFTADSAGIYVSEAERCDWYIPREALTKEPSRSFGRKGMKSNRHVLPHQRKRMTPEELGLKKPDLMVKRHIKMGININEDKEG